MIATHKQRMLVFVIAALISIGFALVTTQHTHAHDGEVHSEEHTLSTSDADRIKNLKKLVSLLEELRDLLESKVERVHDHEEHAHELSISVEEHGGRTHIHVYEGDTQTDAFFLDGLAPTQEDAVIEAITERTGFAEHTVRDAISFPVAVSMEHEDHESEEMHAHGENDLSGIHIMNDGTVMLGDGTVLADATVTEDGLIELSDGTLVEPELDMR